MATLLIRGGRVIDPAQNIDRTDDVLVRDGLVVSIGHEDTDSFEAIEGLFTHLDRNAFEDFLGEDRLLGRAFGGDTVEAFEGRFALLAQGILGDES